MLLALNVVVFVLGYSAAATIALKPNRLSEIILAFARTLHRLSNGRWSITSPRLVPAEAEYPDKPDPTPSISDLLTKTQVEQLYDHDSWQGRAYADFTEKILARGAGMPTFPCVYATMGFRADDHRYVFLESANLAEPRNVRKLAPALSEYLRLSPRLGPNTSLVVIGAPSDVGDGDHDGNEPSVDEYNRSFWDMLRGLRICDPKPWPASIPQDTEHARWTFCFDGQPVFPVMLTPAHQQRWSRHTSTPVVALQPKWVLDRLLGTPEKRDAAQSKVRGLLAKYDSIGVSPDLTSYGEAGTSEVRQLCLQDQNETVQCPYRNFDA